MKSIVNDHFYLQNDLAKKLYHTYAKTMPIIDYHCHLDPKTIYLDLPFRNLSDVWLSGDHYKWRLLRANGVSEDYITGDKSDYDKFLMWAKLVPNLIGNPIYHWTHFELKQYFDIDIALDENTAPLIYEKANDILKTLTPRKLIEMSNVDVICTTDDPLDTLEWHEKIAQDESFYPKVYPTFRPDKAIHIEQQEFKLWVSKLAEIVGCHIEELDTFLFALHERILYFHRHGCRISDHALEVVMVEPATFEEVNMIFKKALNEEILDPHELAQYKGYLLLHLGEVYHKFGWTQQYHLGAIRNLSTRQYKKLGPDTGYDAMGDALMARSLARLLDVQDQNHQLPKTIIYTLNPGDFEVAITIMQSFQDGTIPGKIQFGTAWWFLDSIDGMTKQMKALMANGLFSRFIGMLTDSRSFLSYSRHDYFRRILCHLIADEVEKGLFINDEALLGKIVKAISYDNAKAYFNL